MWDKPHALNWIANALYALALVMMLYALVFVVVHMPIFPLREIRVEGRLAHVTREQVNLISTRYIKGNFFTLDLEKTREAFQKLPWARNVSVRRRWPDQLEVIIEEHMELARWGSIGLVNTHGELFHAASDKDLPIFYGPGDGVREIASHFVLFGKALQGTGMRISQMTLTPRRAWEIKTESGLQIAVGREDMEARISKFANVYHKTIAGLGARIQYVDLRYSNGFAVRVPKQTASKAVKPQQA